MKEIGGYFELANDDKCDREYHNNCVKLNSGRNALLYLIKAKKIKKLYIPYFLCDSIYTMLNYEKVEYVFYHIGTDFKPNINFELNDQEFLYVVNYYGQIENNYIKYLKNKYTNIIVDNAHAFFELPVDGADTLYTIRKYFGVPDGSYLYTDIIIDAKLDTDASDARVNHLIGRKNECANKYYTSYLENEKIFYNLPLMFMSNFTNSILKKIDYEKAIYKRNINFDILYNEFNLINKLNIMKNVGPFAYPLYLKNAQNIREKLINNNIYIPILWPNLNNDNYILENDFAQNILPLPCDQRYDANDMMYIVNEVKKCLN